MRLEDRILTVGVGLKRLVRRLRELGYQFNGSNAVLPGVEADTDAAIERIEREAGTLPLALKLSGEMSAASISTGHHPDWNRLPVSRPADRLSALGRARGA